jgi:hypothetical protein
MGRTRWTKGDERTRRDGKNEMDDIESGFQVDLVLLHKGQHTGRKGKPSSYSPLQIYLSPPGSITSSQTMRFVFVVAVVAALISAADAAIAGCKLCLWDDNCAGCGKDTYCVSMISLYSTR